MIMKRFCFLTVVLAAALCISSCNDNNDEKTFGLCLVSVENVGADFKDSIEKLSEAGIKQIELMNYFGDGQYGMTAEELKAYLDSKGVTVLSSNTMGGSVDVENEEDYLKRWDNLLKEHQVLGAKYVTMTANLYWGDIDRVKKICETLNKIGALAKSYGISFLYHFHNIEYCNIKNTDIMAAEFMLENTDPEYVNFQFDTFWAIQGKIDPVAFMKKHADRIPCLHFKDYYWLSDDSETYAEGYGPLFETFYQYCGKDVILDMEPYMTMEEMQAKVRMHEGITRSETPWPTPRPGNRRPAPTARPKVNADSLNQVRLKSMDAVLTDIEYLNSKSYVK